MSIESEIKMERQKYLTGKSQQELAKEAEVNNIDRNNALGLLEWQKRQEKYNINYTNNQVRPFIHIGYES